MNVRTMSFAVSSLLLCVSGGLGLQACSSSSTTTGENTTADGGGGGGSDSGGGGTGTDSGGVIDTDSGGGGMDAAVACMTPPKLFVPKPDGGMYCPFSAGGDGGSKYCKTGTEMCCLSPSADAGSSDCEKQAATCTNAAFKPWECSSPIECAGNAAGTTCCLTAGPVGPDKNCSGYQKTLGFDSTKCMQAAACTGTVMVGMYKDDLTIVCEQQSDCPGGKTCTAVKTTGTSLGLCL